MKRRDERSRAAKLPVKVWKKRWAPWREAQHLRKAFEFSGEQQQRHEGPRDAEETQTMSRGRKKEV